jgi:predicted acetyltransferase
VLAGFALLAERSRLTGAIGVTDMAEFFVMRRYRRQASGSRRRPRRSIDSRGPWEVRQRPDNVDATAFWRRAIGRYTNGSYREII